MNRETALNSSVDIEELDEVSVAHRGPDGSCQLQPGDPNRPQTDLTSLLLDQFLTPIDKDVTAAASTEAAAASQLNASILSQTSTTVSETVKNLNETSGVSSSDYGNRSRLVRASFATKNVQGRNISLKGSGVKYIMQIFFHKRDKDRSMGFRNIGGSVRSHALSLGTRPQRVPSFKTY